MTTKNDGKSRISNREWKARHREAAEKCKALQVAAQKRALAPGISAAAQVDAWSEANAYGTMAESWQRSASGRDDWRDVQEAKGSAEGIERRKTGSTFVTDNFLDELREIHDPEESAEWHRRKLDRSGSNPPKLRAMQRALRKIRNT